MCRFTSRTWFIIKPGMARHSLLSASALRLAGGWIAILIGDTEILFTGATIIRVRLIGGMSRHIRGTIIKQLSGIPTIIRAQLGLIMATGAMPPHQRNYNQTTIWHSNNHPSAAGT